jgi:hypothetical protein
MISTGRGLLLPETYFFHASTVKPMHAGNFLRAVRLPQKAAAKEYKVQIAFRGLYLPKLRPMHD